MRGYTRKKLEQLQKRINGKGVSKKCRQGDKVHQICTLTANVNINRLVRKKGKKSLVGAFQLSHCNDAEEDSDFNHNSSL
jgi:hypothetical protein